MIHTLIVDNDMLFRAGIRMMIDSSSDITVAGEATTGLEALDMIQATNVDIVLMDISIPQLNGVEATKKIVDIPNCPKILILTSYGMDEELFNALAAGATGFLLKDSPPEGLLTAISSAYNGNAVISPQLTDKLVEEYTSKENKVSPINQALSKLTDREREVLELIGLGRNNAEIAHELFIAEVTVKTHVGRVLRKINARDRVHAVVLAYHAGIVKPDGGPDSDSVFYGSKQSV